MSGKRVSLFVTCLVDQFYPEVGQATVKLLRSLGVEVDFPPEQTCCGQVALNGGYRTHAAAAARRFVQVFRDAEAVVAPSGSCVATVHAHYGALLRDDPALALDAAALQARTWELSQYIVDVLGVEDVGARLPAPARVTCHDCCHALRDLGVAAQPRALLANVGGVELAEMQDAAACCGFGGTFAIKFADISEAILREKLRNAAATGADVLTAVDASCLMHMGGALRRQPAAARPVHLAELLASGLPEARP